MKIKFSIVLALITTLTASSCGYWPFLDYFLPADFSPMGYHNSLGADSSIYILSNDSLTLSVSAIASLPNKKRSRRLNFFWVDLNLNLSDKTQSEKNWKINLKQSKISVTSNNVVLNGRVTGEIVGDSLTVLTFNRNSKHHTIQIKFEYEKTQEYFLKSHFLTINLIKLFSDNGEMDIEPMNLKLYSKE